MLERERRELYPLGVQDFSSIIKGGYVYVDKTRYIHELIQDGGKYFFLARPRRFGKSLLLSTLEYFFEGKRELFKGLEIDRLQQEWEAYPVLHFDLNPQDYHTPDALTSLLQSQIARYEHKYGVEGNAALPPTVRLGELLWKIYEKTGRQSVVLVDEYDKPLVNSLEDESLCDRFRGILKGFYGNLKTYDRYIRFAMLTGVTRFSKVSIFSDLNNLRDISMTDRFACICGITQEELTKKFPRGITALGEANDLSREDTLEELRKCYDGYHFAKRSEGVYNPFSLLNAFTDLEFGHYWYSSAMTTMLARRVRSDRWNLPALRHAIATPTKLANIDAFRDPVPLLYQTGYLTLTGYDPRGRVYTLDYPNREVREGFEEALFDAYVTEGLNSDFDVFTFREDIERGHTEEFMRRLTAMFASFPYEDASQGEYWFRSIIYTVFMMVGQMVRVERHTAGGRSDLEVFTRDKIYIFEFKYGNSHTPQEAIAQIEERGYLSPYAADSRKKVLIGAVYRPATRSLCWEAREVG